ncbi:MAG: glycosyltransferase [Saprospiraceae bacterium]|nr:glycosyltransferase [Saprospiraceae bacterium]MCO5284475.1 glycosyltransferase [Saprospiraceae bacterium]
MEISIKPPLLSVVIPTKNRYEYLEILLKKLSTLESSEFEVIIQDNSDNNNDFLQYLELLDDKRVKYFYKSGWISVIDNCDLAVGNATGKYICMIGDDDGILIEPALRLLDYLESSKIDAAIVNPLSYTWPDTNHIVWDSLSGRAFFKKFSMTYKILDSKTELEKVIGKGGSFGLNKLPRIYHGFVRRNVLEMLKKDTGTYFPGPSPDMANAVGLSNYLSEYLYADFPIIISGQGKKSTGGQGSEKQHHGRIENQSHLPKDTASKWSDKIPYFWSGPTIYAESLRRALIATGRKDNLNYSFLYAVCLVYERQYLKEIWKVVFGNKNFLNCIMTLFLILYYIFITVMQRLETFIKNIVQYKIMKQNNFVACDIQEVIVKSNDFFYKN